MATKQCPECDIELGESEIKCPKCGIDLEQFSEETINNTQRALNIIRKREEKNKPQPAPSEHKPTFWDSLKGKR